MLHRMSLIQCWYSSLGFVGASTAFPSRTVMA
jgi:hypothetical protein